MVSCGRIRVFDVRIKTLGPSVFVYKMTYIYLLASGRNGTLYIGVTRYLIKRVNQYKSKRVPGFTNRCQINRFVWCQQSDAIESAIVREKQIKAWRRMWKIALIKRSKSY